MSDQSDALAACLRALSATPAYKAGDAVVITLNINAAEGDGWMSPVGRIGIVRRVERGSVLVDWEETKNCCACISLYPTYCLSHKQPDLFG